MNSSRSFRANFLHPVGVILAALVTFFLPACSGSGPQAGVVIHKGHVPEYTKDRQPVSVAIAKYVPVPGSEDRYQAERGSRIQFEIPAYLLVSKWNLMGGDQESIVMEANSETLRPWEECLGGSLERPVPRCPGQRPLLIRVWSNLRPAVPPTIRPDLKDFPASDLTSFHGRHVSPVGREQGFEIVGYDDIWSRSSESRTAKFGKVDLYSSSLFLYPSDFQHDPVKFVDCERLDSFCKAYTPFRGKWVEFQVYKDQMPDARRIASGIAGMLSRMLGDGA
ncbi:MAG: hypothetical protein ACJ8F4_09965 [Sphingomonas sp.]